MKTVIIKLTGEVIERTTQGLRATAVQSLAPQIKKLKDSHIFGIVIGGGNFFRGAQQSSQVQVAPQTGHTVGMLATMMNGLIVQDIFEQAGIKTTLFSALPCSSVGLPISPQGLREAKNAGRCMIFSGGTGNPFFSTDTTAVVRALEIDATELWKGTKVDGVYSADPAKNPAAKLVKHLTYRQVLDGDIHVMDSAAFALAEPYNLVLRIFNIFADDALIKAAQDPDFGSTIVQL